MKEVMLYISKNKVSALDVGEAGDTEWISLEGESDLRYSQENDLRQFCGYLKEYYNIEDFSEIDHGVKIISFDADRKNVDYLYQQMRNAIDVNIIDAKNIIPLLLLKETTVQKDMKYQVSVYDTDYCVVVDDQLRCECTVSEKARESICFELEKFALFSRFDCKNLMGDEKKCKELEEKYQKLEMEYETEQLKYQSKYQDLLKENNDHIRNNRKLEQDLEQLKKRLKDILNEKSSSRIVCKFNIDKTEEWKFGNYKNKHIICLKSSNGMYVEKGTVIAEVNSFVVFEEGTLIDEVLACVTEIQAQESGRIYYLCKNGDKIINHQEIAIIGHQNDTREEVMEWYKKVNGLM